MPFVIQTSSISAAIGAGSGGKEVHFNDLTHRLTFSNPDGELAVALATFGEGKELDQAKEWAKNAHGFTKVDVEPFDATTEADRRQAEADKEAADREAANTEAKRILNDAKNEAASLIKQAQAEAAELNKQASANVAASNEALAAAQTAQKKADDTMSTAQAALKQAQDAAKKGGLLQRGG
jgi:hypothetical protein